MMGKSNSVRLMIPLLAAGLLLAGCTAGTGSGQGSGNADGAVEVSDTLRANWGGFPESWAPGTQAALPGYLRVPYETLVLREADGEILPNLATAWEFGEGAKSLTLTLREGVKFHDGTDFNAAAVKAVTEYVANEVGGQFGGPIKAGVANVEVVDDLTVVFHFTRPYASFLDLLSQRHLMMASPAAIADGSIATHPVGTGPWKYDPSQSVKETKMVFAEFEDYWGVKPAFRNIELYGIADQVAAIAALTTDELDVTYAVRDVLPRVEDSDELDYFEYPAIRNNVTFFDTAPGGLFSDERVRQALCMAMDNTVVEDMKDGHAQAQHFLEGEPGYNPAITPFQGDLAGAKKLWAELGNPTIKIDWAAAPFTKQEVTVRAEQMNQLENVEITVQELAVPQFLGSWNSGQYPLGLGNHSEINPSDWYGAWFAETSPANPAKDASEELKSLAGMARAAGTSPEANDKWAAVTKQIADEARSCSHFVAVEFIAYNSSTVDQVKQAMQAWEPKLIDYRAVKPKG